MEFQRGGASGCARPAIAAIDSDGLYIELKQQGKNNGTTLGFVFVNSGGFIFPSSYCDYIFLFSNSKNGTTNQMNGARRNSRFLFLFPFLFFFFLRSVEPSSVLRLRWAQHWGQTLPEWIDGLSCGCAFIQALGVCFMSDLARPDDQVAITIGYQEEGWVGRADGRTGEKTCHCDSNVVLDPCYPARPIPSHTLQTQFMINDFKQPISVVSTCLDWSNLFFHRDYGSLITLFTFVSFFFPSFANEITKCVHGPPDTLNDIKYKKIFV